jgi:hypothetical protein
MTASLFKSIELQVSVISFCTLDDKYRAFLGSFWKWLSKACNAITYQKTRILLHYPKIPSLKSIVSVTSEMNTDGNKG